MFALEITFPARRYHATPWGNHVNEGIVEWPPSPWRIARALLSVGYTHLGWGETVPDAFGEIVDAIGSSPPDYAIPPSVETHTRHYMPVPGTTSKVLDTCKRMIDSQPLLIRFDAELSDPARSLLKALAENMSYLGRAESWVDVSLVDEVPDDRLWCSASKDELPAINSVSQRLMIPMASTEYETWRTASLDHMFQQDADVKGKAPTKAQQRKLAEPFPETVVDCLSVDTLFLAKFGWSQPPGSRWVQYNIPAEPPRRASITRPRPTGGAKPALPTTAVLSLTSDSVSGTTLPPLGRTLFIAEAIHKAAVDRSTSQFHCVSPQLTGKYGVGEINKHRHAHFLPMDLDGDKKIDHVLIHCADGLDFETQSSLASIPAIYSQNLPRMAVTWVGCGDHETIQRFLAKQRNRRNNVFGSATTFRSITPFVASRHLRRNYQLPQNLADECRFRDLPSPIESDMDIQPNAGSFRLSRIEDDRRPPTQSGYYLTIKFGEPVSGPITLGYGSHFGLGLFAAVTS